MASLKIIRTNIGEKDFELFEAVPENIYPVNSQRFILGHDPVNIFLEGCYVLLKDNTPVGRFAFYENPLLSYENQSACTIGSFECINDEICAHFLLNQTVELARSKGYKQLVGPMEGSTWDSYRFSLNNDAPNFFMEPYHHNYYSQLFVDFGFKSIANYISNVDIELNFDESRIAEFEAKFKKMGANLRQLNIDDLVTDLYKIAKFSNQAFKENFLFTPIDEGYFIEKYSAYAPYFNPESTWIVEDGKGEIHALSFNIKDYLNKLEPTLIVKTLARKKDSPFKGIGRYLGQKTYQLAKEQGYKRLIHALMIQDNSSVILSEKYNIDSFKSYELYSYAL